MDFTFADCLEFLWNGEEWVNEAVNAGAELLTGGKRISDSCYECTILYNPPPETKVSQLEIFGPVICVYPYSDMDQAIAQANALPYAFQAAVFTQNIETAMRVYSRLDASAVMINEHTAFRVDWMPFAGSEAVRAWCGRHSTYHARYAD